MRCRPSRRVKLSAWLRLQVNTATMLQTLLRSMCQVCSSTAFLMWSRSHCLHPSQHGQTQSDLPSRLQNGLLQLQPSAHVERWLPDRYTPITTSRNPAVIVILGVVVSPPSPSALVFSGTELPDSLQGDAPKPGSVSAEWRLRLHPETGISEKPVLSVRSQHANQRALAEEEDLPCHGEVCLTLHLKESFKKVPCGDFL